jgi:electron transfer DM13
MALTRKRRMAGLMLAAVVAAVGIPVAWYLGSPLFINTRVDESFPVGAAPAKSAPAAGSAAPPAVVLATPTPVLAPAPGPTAQPAQPVAKASEAAPPVMSTPAPAAVQPASGGPIALGSGQFGMIDAIHRGEGTATLFRLPDGGRVLRFEDFNVTNGPDLFVYLSGHPAPRDSRQLHDGGAFEVARLKGNVGNQNYELPPDLDLAQFKSVVIYCRRFSVVFSTAELGGGAS